MSLVVGLTAFKSGQKGMMNIDNSSRGIPPTLVVQLDSKAQIGFRPRVHQAPANKEDPAGSDSL